MKSFNGLTMPFLLPELAARGDADADDDEALVQLGRSGEGGHGTRNSCPVSFHLKCHVISKSCFLSFQRLLLNFKNSSPKEKLYVCPSCWWQLQQQKQKQQQHRRHSSKRFTPLCGSQEAAVTVTATSKNCSEEFGTGGFFLGGIDGDPRMIVCRNDYLLLLMICQQFYAVHK